MKIYNYAKDKKDKKNLDDTHINMRLKEQHEDKSPEVITEKQLEVRSRDGEQEVLLEKLLDAKRTGSAEVILEKNLNDSKGLFGTKHRNADAYTGDINKIEEKRLSGKNTEDEKYESASSTPKKMKWWEGIKKSSSDKTVKIASIDNSDPEFPSDEVSSTYKDLDFDPADRFSRLRDMIGEGDDEGVLPDDDKDVSDLIDKPGRVNMDEEEDGLQKDSPKNMFLFKNQYGEFPVPNIYMQLRFDPAAFNNDEDEIKDAALEKVLEERPNLTGKIGVENFSSIQEGPLDSFIRLILTGDEYLSQPEEGLGEDTSLFLNFESEEVNGDGTPMTIGRVSLSPRAEEMDEEGLLQGIQDYIADKGGFDVPSKSIQINMAKHEATFVFDEEADPEILDERSVPSSKLTPPVKIPEPTDDFDVTEAPEATEESEIKPLASRNAFDFPIVIADSKKN